MLRYPPRTSAGEAACQSASGRQNGSAASTESRDGISRGASTAAWYSRPLRTCDASSDPYNPVPSELTSSPSEAAGESPWLSSCFSRVRLSAAPLHRASGSRDPRRLRFYRQQRPLSNRLRHRCAATSDAAEGATEIGTRVLANSTAECVQNLPGSDQEQPFTSSILEALTTCAAAGLRAATALGRLHPPVCTTSQLSGAWSQDAPFPQLAFRVPIARPFPTARNPPPPSPPSSPPSTPKKPPPGKPPLEEPRQEVTTQKTTAEEVTAQEVTLQEASPESHPKKSPPPKSHPAQVIESAGPLTATSSNEEAQSQTWTPPHHPSPERPRAHTSYVCHASSLSLGYRLVLSSLGV